MFGDYRVIVVTPAGRRRYLELLTTYVRRARPLIDEHHLWVNTNVTLDLEYLSALRAEDPAFVKLIHVEPEFKAAYDACVTSFGFADPSTKVSAMLWRTAIIGAFYPFARDPRCIYVRLDDDICYIAPGALEALVAFRVAHPRYFCVIANTINHPLCTFIHQRLGLLGHRAGTATADPLCDIGWRSGAMAEFVHESFLARVRAGELDALKFGSWIIHDYQRVGINGMAYFGRDLATYQGAVTPWDEEVWISSEMPARFERPNCVCGAALVTHFAYFPQRPYLEGQTDLLARYRVLAGLDGAAASASMTDRRELEAERTLRRRLAPATSNGGA